MPPFSSHPAFSDLATPRSGQDIADLVLCWWSLALAASKQVIAAGGHHLMKTLDAARNVPATISNNGSQQPMRPRVICKHNDVPESPHTPSRRRESNEGRLNRLTKGQHR